MPRRLPFLAVAGFLFTEPPFVLYHAAFLPGWVLFLSRAQFKLELGIRGNRTYILLDTAYILTEISFGNGIIHTEKY